MRPAHHRGMTSARANSLAEPSGGAPSQPSTFSLRSANTPGVARTPAQAQAKPTGQGVQASVSCLTSRRAQAAMRADASSQRATTGHLATASALKHARGDANAVVAEREKRRADHEAVTEQYEVSFENPSVNRSAGDETARTKHLVELIAHELQADADHVPLAATSLGDGVTPLPSMRGASAANAKTQAAVELIEKIDTLIRSQRPVMAMTLRSALAARVEIERTGPREVAIRLVGRDGPPHADDVSRIRDELKVRGLKVSSLSVA